ncbi:MAG: phosphomannomutase/phosphoglucomutase [Patescibacteria group bacterium]
MEFPAHIFRTYDIRGLLEEVTEDVARRAGMALVAMTGARTVLVGRDMRATSPALAKAAIEGITSMGAHVVEIGMCSTSMYNFAVTSRAEIEAGLMVTASHNPPEYNGIKMAHHNGMPIAGSEIKLWCDKDLQGATEKGSVSSLDILPEYLDACVARGGESSFAGTRVVIDYGNGMGALSFVPLCQRLGVEVVSLFSEPDASFPNHDPNPAVEKNLRFATAAILESKADLGIALDGDADRVGFLDNEGVPLRGDLALAIFARDLLQRTPGKKVILAPNQSWTTADTVRKYGGIPVMKPVGRTIVIGAMHSEGAPLGGEVSSHFFFEEFNNLESVDYAFVRMLSLWKASGVLMADFVRDVRVYANSWEINIEVRDKAAALATIESVFVPKATVVERVDGIRCEFDREWWFIVRQSNTEPVIRITIEAKTDAEVAEHREELVSCLKADGHFVQFHP